MNENTTKTEGAKLGQKPTAKFLLKFTIPTILSYFLMGVFGMVDQIFASRNMGVEAMASVSLVLPFLMSLIAFGSMLAMGGCALVTKKLGKNQHGEARQNFSLLTIVVTVIALAIASTTWILRESVLTGLLGANEQILGDALLYMEPLIIAGTVIILGIFLVQYMIANGKPALAMIATVSGAIVSTILNIIFIIVLEMGVQGLAIATGVGYSLPAVISLVYFTFARKGSLYFVKPRWDIKAIGRAMANGTSEFITMMMIPVTKIVMNNILINMDGIGVMGVASAGIAMGLMNIFSALFIGFSAGMAPIVTFNHGSKKSHGMESGAGQGRRENLRNLYKKGLVMVGALSVIALLLTTSLASPLVSIFETRLMVDFDFLAGIPIYYDIHTMTVRGLRIISSGFLLMGINIFATQWFTAFNDGLVSGFISLMQTAVFTVTLLLTLPRVLDLNGVWMALPLAEVLTVALSIFFLVKMGQKYHYAKPRNLLVQA